MTDSVSQKRRRHIPQHGAQHVYYSIDAKGRKRFEVRGPAPDRRYEPVSPNTLAEAKRRARELHSDTAPPVSRVGMRLGEVIASWVEVRQIRPSTAASYDSLIALYIAPRFGRVKVRDISPTDIEAWIARLKRKDGKPGPLADGTRRLIFAVTDIVLEHACELGALSVNPARRIKRGRRPRQGESRRRVLSPDEEQRLLAYCAPFPWLRPIVIVALYEALRLGEVLGLQWDDVDFAAGKLHVRHSLGRDGTLGPPKGGKHATIDLTPPAREAMLELRQDSDGTGLVFHNREGGHRQARDVQRAFTNARDRAALPVTDAGRVVFHALRHTGISRLANHPAVPLVHVRDLARHSDLAVTQGYVHKIASETVTAAIGEALAGTHLVPE